jgi:PhnB protein
MPIQPIPEDCRAPTPYLVVDDAARALEFYRDAFGAEETMRLGYPDGRIGHAEIRIGAGRIMLADEHPEVDCLGPRSLGGSPTGLVLYVADVDAAIARAVAAGAQLKCAVRDEFYGDRVGDLVDPFGHRWTLASRIEEVSADEVRRRFDAAVRSASPA